LEASRPRPPDHSSQPRIMSFTLTGVAWCHNEARPPRHCARRRGLGIKASSRKLDCFPATLNIGRGLAATPVADPIPRPDQLLQLHQHGDDSAVHRRLGLGLRLRVRSASAHQDLGAASEPFHHAQIGKLDDPPPHLCGLGSNADNPEPLTRLDPRHPP